MNEKLLNLVSEVLNVSPDKISLSTKRTEIEEWDSLAQIQLAAELEEQLQAVIPFEEIGKIEKIADYLKFIPGVMV